MAGDCESPAPQTLFRTRSSRAFFSEQWCHWERSLLQSLPSGGALTCRPKTHLRQLSLHTLYDSMYKWAYNIAHKHKYTHIHTYIHTHVHAIAFESWPLELGVLSTVLSGYLLESTSSVGIFANQTSLHKRVTSTVTKLCLLSMLHVEWICSKRPIHDM